MITSRMMCGAVVLNRERRRLADVAETRELRNKGRHRPLQIRRRQTIQSGWIN
jgi:hypothetical protein